MRSGDTDGAGDGGVVAAEGGSYCRVESDHIQVETMEDGGS